MDELARELGTLGDELSPHWDEARSERLFAGVGRLQRRRKTVRMSASALVVLAVCVTGAVAVHGAGAYRQQPMAAAAATAATPVPTSATHGAGAQASTRGTIVTPATVAADALAVAAATSEPAALHAGQSVQLADGSLVQVGSQGVLTISGNQAQNIQLRLLDGAAHFSVVPNHDRQFVIDAGAVQVVVIGTVFDVDRAQLSGHARVHVAVVEGKVRVAAADGEHFVSGGQEQWFDELGAFPTAESASASGGRAERAHRVAHRDASVKAAWRSLSQAGDYEQAYSSLSSGAVVEDDPAALMDAADAARLSGHPDAAALYLRRVLKDHRQSPVAALAAFTLGRVLLERLGQPSEAAESFALARTLAPHGSLAQDALAREVEALSKAGDAHDAYVRAQQYVQVYPAGRRLHAVRLYGGLE